MAEWENMVPKNSVSDYVPSNASTTNNEDDTKEVNLKGKVEIKRTPWHKRTLSNFRKNWPSMLFGVAIPEMGKIIVTKTFDVIYSSIFNEPYYGGSKGNGYFFNNSSVFDYTDFWKGAGSTNKGYDLPKNKFSYSEFAFTDRRDVEEIIMRMIEKAQRQRCISVSELYTIIRKTLKKARYPDSVMALLETDNYANLNYGWFLEDLRFAHPGTVGKDMYYLDLPEEKPIK